MTRKHFEMLAQALANVRPSDVVPLVFYQWERDCAAVISVLRHANSRFDAGRFMEACRTYPKTGHGE